MSEEFIRRREVAAKRKNTPCKFKDGISQKEFLAIAHNARKRNKRIKSITVKGAVILCVVESQTGFSTWEYSVDFNDWGHITGMYWYYSENNDSNIPKHFGDVVSGEIQHLLREKKIELPEYSDFIDANQDLGTINALEYLQPRSFLQKIFIKEKQLTSKYDSQDLMGEHIYLVISFLKSNGYKSIKSIPVFDVGCNSDKYEFEVERVSIGGKTYFEIGDSFTDNSDVLILYHAKKYITMPYTMKYFKGKNYSDVVDELFEMGFSNIYTSEIQDLVTGWLKNDGYVEKILIKKGEEVFSIEKNQSYVFDSKIVITYHTYK